MMTVYRFAHLPHLPFAHLPFLWCLLIGAVLVMAGCDSDDDLMTDTGPPPDPRIRLVGQLAPAPDSLSHSDVWGYVDPNTGREYALVGGFGAPMMFIVDATDPAAPVHMATAEVPGFDIKVWDHYAYTVTGGGDRSFNPEGRIVDLSDPANPVVVGEFPSAHNIFIDDRGFMYLEVPGLRIMDLNADPVNPTLIWEDEGRNGHDASVIGDRLYDFHGRAGTHLYDVSTPAAPTLLGSITLPTIRYHHSGWTSTDGRYLFICDELSQGLNPDITIWDIQDPANPVLSAEIGDSTATVHNLYILDDLAYVSYYAAGFRLYDVSDATTPRMLDEFDTEPTVASAGFDGAWGVYPFTPSGHIYVSDRTGGLYIFALER